MATIKDSGDEARRVFRVCHECGSKLNVTYLIAKRRYACAECGMPFIHHPALASPEVETKAPRGMLVRVLPPVVFAGAAPYLLSLIFELTIPNTELLAISGGALLFALISVSWVRKLSKDPAGVMAPVMVILGFSLISLMMLREIPEDAGDQTQIEMRLMMSSILLIGIGALIFGKYMKNRASLVRVSADGKV